MTGAPAGDVHAGTSPGLPERPPWAEWSWVIQSVWLLFLGFPLVALVTGSLTAWEKALGVLIVAAFGVVYATGIRRTDRLEDEGSPIGRAGATHLVGLVVLAGLSIPLVGLNATTFLPFVVAFAMFSLPLWAGAAVGVAAVVISVVISIRLLPDASSWVITLIVFSVATMTLWIRIVLERGAHYQALSRELELVEERERVARDVHDVLGHSLTVVTLKAELAERLIELDPARARQELADIQELSRQALAEIRETVGGLRSARLTVELTAARIALTGAGITSHLPEGVDEVDPRHRTVLAWVLREAVTNVVRHSDATTCRIDLGTNVLRVTDDGRGLDGRAPGNGLRGVRERVEAAGGHLQVGPGQDGHGTVLEVTL